MFSQVSIVVILPYHIMVHNKKDISLLLSLVANIASFILENAVISHTIFT